MATTENLNQGVPSFDAYFWNPDYNSLAVISSTKTMVKGRQGLYLEAWKFGVYLSIPAIASVYYSNPENQRYWADYWKFIEYPENPNTNVKQTIQQLAKEKEAQREQRRAYQEQLQRLQEAASRSNNFETKTVDNQDRQSWWHRFGGWISGRKHRE